MNSRNWLLIKGGIALLVLWIVVGGVIKVAGNMRPTAGKVAKYAQDNSLTDISDPDERKEVIGRIAEMMNQLEPDELQELEEKTSEEDRQAMFESMSAKEQWFFMEKRMGRAFTQMMEVFNKMERSERKLMVERALEEIKNDTNRRRPMGDEDPEMVEKIASAGLKAYFEDSSAETKMDLAPLMEEVQKIMSNPERMHRRRGK